MNRLLLASVIVGIGTVSPAVAQESAPFGTPRGFSAGVEAFDYRYRERDGGRTIVWDDGRLGGFELGYAHPVGSTWFVKGQLGVAWGLVDYRSDEGSRLDDVRQSTGRLEIVVGRDLPMGTITLTPHIGFGARVLHDESGGRTSPDGLLGYDREVEYGYVPVGVTLRSPLGRQARLSLSAQTNFVTGGRVASKFSEIDPEAPDIRLDLNGGRGWEAAAAIEVPIGRRTLSVGPFARGWRIKQSESRFFTDGVDTLVIYEPPSRTTEIGIRATLQF